MTSKFLKACFVQPNTGYQVAKHRYGAALTFPKLIQDLKLTEEEYVVFWDGLETTGFREFLGNNEVTHVLITSITSTFPRAVDLAAQAQNCGCVTVLGGLFATLNPHTIANNFSVFDYIVSGRPDLSLLSTLNKPAPHPVVLKHSSAPSLPGEIWPILSSNSFDTLKNADIPVCYEITNGCPYQCLFCTLRKAWAHTPITSQNTAIVRNDLANLSAYWNKLKIIDDDILLNTDILQNISAGDFYKEVVVETRVDRINTETVRILRDFGATHIIMGIESFSNSSVQKMNKYRGSDWSKQSRQAIELCTDNNIVVRPVIMITPPDSDEVHLDIVLENIKDWNAKRGIELLISFYTPHPGMDIRVSSERLITNDLEKFNHLNLVYLPEPFAEEDIPRIAEYYNEMVMMTGSFEYNPPIDLSRAMKEEYRCFFDVHRG